MSNFWISWFHTPAMGGFELHSPWWVSGSREVVNRLAFDEGHSEPTICAAVQADDEDGAKEAVVASYDMRPSNVEWRFCEPRADDWTPFNERFPKADWMTWPPRSPQESASE